jgi:hypothetical protein
MAGLGFAREGTMRKVLDGIVELVNLGGGTPPATGVVNRTITNVYGDRTDPATGQAGVMLVRRIEEVDGEVVEITTYEYEIEPGPAQ